MASIMDTKTFVATSNESIQDIKHFLKSINAEYEYLNTLFYIRTSVDIAQMMYHPFKEIMEVTI